MQIVPVIDLKGGQVVHARAGRRNSYRAIRSRLADDSTPRAVVQGLRALHPFDRLYVADLDAIAGGSGHDAALEALRAAFPGLELWVDNGLSDERDCRAWLERGLGDLVIGSESQRDPGLLGALDELSDRLILSLDFQGDAFLGPPGLIARTADWPLRVIAMTLSRVGGGLGPDLKCLRWLIDFAPGRQVFAAGGVRGLDDLKRLAELGVGGALVASALHDGRITAAQLGALGESR